ncbi:MAG: hypothetical protein KatS3mg087_1250 [Patescibacteria group bacterium]|nr:MAG: hypothetical protein KatS3mg087_1250 [Patescibacteria group bacterium]
MKDTEELLPTVEELVNQLMSPGTVLGALEFPEKPITLPNSKLSPVKTLEVRVLSTESNREALLNKLHNSTIGI